MIITLIIKSDNDTTRKNKRATFPKNIDTKILQKWQIEYIERILYYGYVFITGLQGRFSIQKLYQCN